MRKVLFACITLIMLCGAYAKADLSDIHPLLSVNPNEYDDFNKKYNSYTSGSWGDDFDDPSGKPNNPKTIHYHEFIFTDSAGDVKRGTVAFKPNDASDEFIFITPENADLFPGYSYPDVAIAFKPVKVQSMVFEFDPDQLISAFTFKLIPDDSLGMGDFTFYLSYIFLCSFDEDLGQWIDTRYEEEPITNVKGNLPIYFGLETDHPNEYITMFAVGFNHGPSNALDHFILTVDSVYTPPSPTPEPATMLILGLGAIGAGFAVRRRMSK